MAQQAADFGALVGRIAAVTGGGSGMGRELCIQLAAAGCHVSFCDLSIVEMDETKALCESGATHGARVSCHVCDVSSEQEVLAFRDAVMRVHSTDCIHFVFNNAGVASAHSFLDEAPRERKAWEKTFDVDWYGVYYSSRAFVPLLKRADEAFLVNTSSVNGFWASMGPGSQHSAYSAAKFAVKGFSEALHVEFQTHAPHIHVAVVMPGHIGTSIFEKSGAEVDPKDGKWKRSALTPEAKQGMIDRITRGNPKMAQMLASKSDAESDVLIEQLRETMRSEFKSGGLSAADAAGLIIRGTLEKRWRILIGDDAYRLDQAVRSDPEGAYADKGGGLFAMGDSPLARMWDSKKTEGWAAAGALRPGEPTATAEPAPAGGSSRARL